MSLLPPRIRNLRGPKEFGTFGWGTGSPHAEGLERCKHVVGAMILSDMPLVTGTALIVVAIWEAFYIENMHFDLDTLRGPSRSPTPISKPNDFLGQSDDIWGARGFISGRFWGFPGPGPAYTTHIV